MNIIKVTLPTSAIEVAKMQADVEKDALFLLTTEVVTAIDYSDADEILTDVVRNKDALVAMRKRATEPLKASAKEIESWFAPAVRTLCEVESFLKGKMGAYQQRLADAKAAADEAAARAAEAHDAPALLEAMASVPVAASGRATCGWFWKVIRVNADVVRDEDKIPDVAKFDAIAKAHPGADVNPPVIPGVSFERCARIGARR
jgi:hypothetical protein